MAGTVSGKHAVLYKGSKEDDLLVSENTSLFVDPGYVRTANYGAEYVDQEPHSNYVPFNVKPLLPPRDASTLYSATCVVIERVQEAMCTCI